MTVVSGAGEAPTYDFDAAAAAVSDLEDEKIDPRFPHALFLDKPLLTDLDMKTIAFSTQPMSKEPGQKTSVWTLQNLQRGAGTFIVRNAKVVFGAKFAGVPGADGEDLSKADVQQLEDGTWIVTGEALEKAGTHLKITLMLDPADEAAIEALNQRIAKDLYKNRTNLFTKGSTLKSPEDVYTILTPLAAKPAGYSSYQLEARVHGWAEYAEHTTIKLITSKRDGSRSYVPDVITWKKMHQFEDAPCAELRPKASEIVLNVRDPSTRIVGGVSLITPAREDGSFHNVKSPFLTALRPNGRKAALWRRVTPADLAGATCDALLQITAVSSNGLTSWICCNVLALTFDPAQPRVNPHHMNPASRHIASSVAVMRMIAHDSNRLSRVAPPVRSLAPVAALLTDLPVVTPKPDVYAATRNPTVLIDEDSDHEELIRAANAASEAIARATASAAPSAGVKRRHGDREMNGAREARVSLTIGSGAVLGGVTSFSTRSEMQSPPPAQVRPSERWITPPVETTEQQTNLPQAPSAPIKRARQIDADGETLASPLAEE